MLSQAHELFLSLTRLLCLQRHRPLGNIKQNPGTDSPAQTHAAQLCWAPRYSPFTEGWPSPSSPFPQHVHVTPAALQNSQLVPCPAWGCPWANPVPFGRFPQIYSLFHIFLVAPLGHGVTGHNPRPCVPGDVKAQAVRCSSHCSAHLPAVWCWATLSRGRLGKSACQRLPAWKWPSVAQKYLVTFPSG